MKTAPSSDCAIDVIRAMCERTSSLRNLTQRGHRRHQAELSTRMENQRRLSPPLAGDVPPGFWRRISHARGSRSWVLSWLRSGPAVCVTNAGNGYFTLFQSAGGVSGAHTRMGWEVSDIKATVRELWQRGVTFEEYGLPGLKTVYSIARIEGDYPSKAGGAERGRGSETMKAIF